MKFRFKRFCEYMFIKTKPKSEKGRDEKDRIETLNPNEYLKEILYRINDSEDRVVNKLGKIEKIEKIMKENQNLLKSFSKMENKMNLLESEIKKLNKLTCGHQVINNLNRSLSA